MGVAGFWSYSHDDDRRDGGGLLRLATHIRDEYALVTGETLTLFVDRDDISWGEEWRRRIGAALAETTFFIPIITPLYFKRPECRRELLSFVGQAQSLGAIELVMPILYVEVPGMTEDSTDEARALIAKLQYVNWCKVRLSAEDSAEYRQGVNALALKLAEISNEYEKRDDLIESELESSDEEGLMDLLAIIEQKLPLWLDLIDDDKTVGSQLDAISNSYEQRFRKVENVGTSGPRLALLRSCAREAEPAMERILQIAKDFSALSIELDPIILRTLRGLEVHPELTTPVLNFLQPIENAAGELKNQDDRSESLLKRYKGLSKDFDRMLRLSDVEDRYKDDANTLLLRWCQELQDIKRSNHENVDPK